MPAKPDTRAQKRTILLVGAGRMGGALLKGWIARRLAPVAVVEPHASPDIQRFARQGQIALYASIDSIAPDAVRACVIAVKPQVLRGEAARLKTFARNGALIVSIAAGTRVQFLLKACGARAHVIRAMPNLPGAVGRGISALYASANATAADRKFAETLLGALGETVWVQREAMIDAVTAISGSGPAYVFLLTEVLALAAIAEGLPRPLAAQLARATIAGSGALLDADLRDPEQLRRDVTSPKGTTEAALKVLMRNDALAKLIGRAVTAARKRAQELSR